jgi:hypothetical protein
MLRKYTCIKCGGEYRTTHPTRMCCIRCTGGRGNQVEFRKPRLICNRCKGPLLNGQWAHFGDDPLPWLVCGTCAETGRPPTQPDKGNQS